VFLRQLLLLYEVRAGRGVEDADDTEEAGVK